eukprot:179130-Chlamydomonas_euryale.AAC.7
MDENVRRTQGYSGVVLGRSNPREVDSQAPGWTRGAGRPTRRAPAPPRTTCMAPCGTAAVRALDGMKRKFHTACEWNARSCCRATLRRFGWSVRICSRRPNSAALHGTPPLECLPGPRRAGGWDVWERVRGRIARRTGTNNAAMRWRVRGTGVV